MNFIHTPTPALALTPQDDGQLSSQSAPLLPFMGRRLQGTFSAEGIVAFAVWGSGSLGYVHVSAFQGSCLLAPNRLLTNEQGFYLAQSQPVILLTNAQYLRFYPARKRAWWDQKGGKSRKEISAARRCWTLPWGVVIIEQRDNDVLIAAGNDKAEAERGLALSAEQIREEAAGYVAYCDQLPQAQPLMRSMVMQSTPAALSSIRFDHTACFSGFAAGMDYSAPARTSYRDGYWTLPAPFPLEPPLVL